MLRPLITFESIHEVLRTLFDKMLPLCGELTGVASAIAGIGAMLYICYRVWQSMARAEPIDVFPLLRPFALGLCILFFEPVVLGGLNGILSPVVQGTHKLLVDQTFDMRDYQRRKDALEQSSAQTIVSGLESSESVDEYTDQLEELGLTMVDVGELEKLANVGSSWSLRGIFNRIMRWLLEMLFDFASLVMDTIRTFYLIVLAILGPLAFAAAVFDGFQASLTQWIAKYVSVYLWLPIADLFGAILSRLQVLTLEKDMELIAQNPLHTFSVDSGVYIVFLVIGICGYFTIPSIASWIVHASGFGAYNRIISRTGSLFVNYLAGMAGARAGDILGHTRKYFYSKTTKK